MLKSKVAPSANALIGEGGLSPVGAVIAVALSAVLVDVNPCNSSGAVLVGAARPEQRARLLRQMMPYGLCAIVVAPLPVWSVFGWAL